MIHLFEKKTDAEYSKVIPNEISSVAIMVCPEGRPYIVCSVNHRQSSELLLSFILPLYTPEYNPFRLRDMMQPLEETVGHNALSCIASQNGQFIVVVEKGSSGSTVKILRVQNARGGGLFCSPRFPIWTSSLKANSVEDVGISLFIREERNTLQVMAVDRKGHVSFAKLRVMDMPEQQPSPLPRRRNPGTLIIRPHSQSLVDGLPFETGSRHSRSTTTTIDGVLEHTDEETR